MPPSTNPKKRALMPSTKLRRTLRAAGHHLNAVVQVGKEGVSDAVVRQLEEALLAHELVKVKVGTESPEDRFEAAERLGTETGGQIAQVLGRTVLVYRRHPERPRFEPLSRSETAKLEERRAAEGAERRERPSSRRGRGAAARRGAAAKTGREAAAKPGRGAAAKPGRGAAAKPGRGAAAKPRRGGGEGRGKPGRRSPRER